MQRSKSVKLTVLSRLAAAMLLISGQGSTDTTLYAQQGHGHSTSCHVMLCCTHSGHTAARVLASAGQLPSAQVACCSGAL